MIANSKYYEYVGILHIHSKYSDGTGTISGIVKDAKKARLDHIIITDHNTARSIRDDAEGLYDGLLVLVGEEIGSIHRSHYLAFGIKETIKPEVYRGDCKRYIKAVKDQGGIGFAAHPHPLENKSFDLKLAPWDEWDDPNYTGLEIWSYMYDWAENVTLSKLVSYYLHPEKAIDGPPPELLRKWDDLCQKRRIVGIGGADVHARHMFPFSFVKFLTYKRVFRGIRTHVLLTSPISEDLAENKRLMYSALSSGHCFFAHDFPADSRGFSFQAFTDDEGILLMGDRAKLRTSAELKSVSPVPAKLCLLKDGIRIDEVDGSTEAVWKNCGRGVYRIEARYEDKPWVYTNPIYLR